MYGLRVRVSGLAELGLIVLLENAGLSKFDATGTTILYRVVTWFVPIVVGTACWWRYSRQNNMVALNLPAEVSVIARANIPQNKH